MHHNLSDTGQDVRCLIDEISFASAGSQNIKSPFHIAPFTPPTDEVRAALLKKNADIVARNRNIANQLRPLTGQESDREVEDVVIGNYFRVVANLHCGGGITVLRLACYAIGWKTGASLCMTIDRFVQDFSTEAFTTIVEAYETWLRPEDVAFNCAKVVLARPSKTKEYAYRIGGAATRVLSRFFDSAFLNMIFNFVGNFFKTSTGVWTSIYSSSNLDYLLQEESPTSDISLGETVIVIAKNACEKSISDTAAKVKSKTRAAAGTASSARQSRNVKRQNIIEPEDNLAMAGIDEESQNSSVRASNKERGPSPVNEDDMLFSTD